jgi:hypothetical protein
LNYLKNEEKSLVVEKIEGKIFSRGKYYRQLYYHAKKDGLVKAPLNA